MEVLPPEPDRDLPRHTFRQYMTEEEARHTDGFSVGRPTSKQLQRQKEENITYLLAKPLWKGLQSLSSEEAPALEDEEYRDIWLEPEERLAFRMHEVILDRMIRAYQRSRRSCERDARNAEMAGDLDTVAFAGDIAGDFVVGTHNLEKIKKELGILCGKLGIAVFHAPDRSR